MKYQIFGAIVIAITGVLVLYRDYKEQKWKDGLTIIHIRKSKPKSRK